jgi:hypothetical protein
MMSRSPLSSTPVTGSATCAVPRAPSSVPVPREAGQVCEYTGVGASAAAATLSWPVPAAIGSASGILSVVVVSRNLTWSGVRVGRCCRSSAAAPDTTAVACDVPDPRNRRPSRSETSRPVG